MSTRRRWLLAVIVGSLALAALPQAAGAQTNSLTLSPSRGAAGTTVNVEGAGCKPAPDTQLALVFVANPAYADAGTTTGTVGEFDLPLITPNADGSFATSFQVPSTLAAWQGQGGGAVKPGTYVVSDAAGACTAIFTVTSGAARTKELPATGASRSTVLLVAVGIGFIASGLILRRSSARRSA